MTVEAILLGSAQDAGVPQAGCYCPTCTRARRERDSRRYVSCLGLLDHATGKSWMIDATPDFREQVYLLDQRGAASGPPDGILLTHAHTGHYTGLIHLGRESWNTSEVPLYVTGAMASFLSNNAPWSQLVALGNVTLHELSPGIEVPLSRSLSVTPIAVPHRAEWSDTIAFLVRGPSRSLFYCPDIDGWERWERPLSEFLAEVDVALLDGTFFSPADLAGRDLSEIPHPFISETINQLDARDCDVHFIHLNHSNPVLSDSPERLALLSAGYKVGVEGSCWVL